MIMPHPLNRPYQQETYDKIINSDAKFIIVQSPTGSGKSAWAAQAACDGHRVISLSHTKSLQVQYEYYDFASLFGKGNYKCLDLDNSQQMEIDLGMKQEELTADICVVSRKNRDACYDTCPYFVEKYKFLCSQAGALNYHKFLSDRRLIEDFNPEYLFLDEAHLLSDLVVDFAGITLNWKSRNLQEYCSSVIIDKPQPLAIIEGRRFLQELLTSLKSYTPLHPKEGGDAKKYKWWERLKERVDIVLKGMDIAPECWFIKSDSEKMIIKPLTARFHFHALFDKAPKLVMMSATIGKIDVFVREMGIKDFEYIEVKNSFPPPMRKIIDLNVPKMGYKSTKEDWNNHSKAIANLINNCPEHWTGIIHSPSKWLSYDLADRLGKMTGRKTFVSSDNIGTEQIVREWEEAREDGMLCVSWAMWEGVNLGSDSICVVSKTPFIDFSEPFDKERFLFDGKAGYQRTCNKLVQGLGRIRRGKPEHYGNSKVVAIADRNWRRLKNYVSKDIIDSIVEQ